MELSPLLSSFPTLLLLAKNLLKWAGMPKSGKICFFQESRAIIG